MYRLDEKILLWIHKHFSSKTADKIMIIVTQFGGPLGVFCIGSFLMFWLAQRGGYQQAGLAMLTIIGSIILNFLLKLIFVRNRPDLWSHIVTENTFSFPSGHAMASMTLALVSVWVFWYSPWRDILIGLSTAYLLIIGFSRLYLGVHYPSDVIMGWTVSLLWMTIIAILFIL